MTNINQNVTMKDSEAMTVRITTVYADEVVPDLRQASAVSVSISRFPKSAVLVTKSLPDITITESTSGVWNVINATITPADLAGLEPRRYYIESFFVLGGRESVPTEGTFTLKGSNNG